MSKESQIKIERSSKNDNIVLSWDIAIAEAERQIEMAKGRIEKLQLVIGGFVEMRTNGEPFPVEMSLLGQDSGYESTSTYGAKPPRRPKKKDGMSTEKW